MYQHDIRVYGSSGIHIPFLPNNTSGRLTMSLNQKVQQPVINKPELPIVDTGYAEQLAKFSYDVVVENDSIFISAIKKHSENTNIWEDEEWTVITVIVFDLVEESLVHYDVPRYRVLGNKFGMSYNINLEYIDSLVDRDLIPAGTKLAISNTNMGGYHRTGRNLNVINCSLPEVGEDCILISDSALKEFGIKLYEQYECSYGKTSLLANVHGDDDKYKAFPDMGDWLDASDIIFSKLPLNIRELKKENFDLIANAVQYTDRGLQTRRPHFSEHTLVRVSGKVVDIEVHHNPVTGDVVENPELSSQFSGYLQLLKKYYQSIMEVYNYYVKNYPNGKISNETGGLIVDAMIFLEKPIKGKTPMVSRMRKKSKLDMYTVKVTMECPIIPNTGFKFSTRYASKGVIKIVKQEDMPRDTKGRIADVAILAKGIVARTNVGLPYEQYFMTSSRQTRDRIRDLLSVKTSDDIETLAESEVNTVFDYLLEYLSHFKTIQYKMYNGSYVPVNTLNNKIADMYTNKPLTHAERVEILKEIFDHELYIIYNVDEKESAYNILCRLEASKFKLEVADIYIKDPIKGGFKKMKSRGFISPTYVVMLNKITDNFLVGGSFFLNGYGLPTGKSKEDGRFNIKYKNTRCSGESETRVFAACGAISGIQGINDRSRSVHNHRIYQRNQLLSKGVTSENLIPNRVEDSDIPINILKAILEPAGITLDVRTDEW